MSDEPRFVKRRLPRPAAISAPAPPRHVRLKGRCPDGDRCPLGCVQLCLRLQRVEIEAERQAGIADQAAIAAARGKPVKPEPLCESCGAPAAGRYSRYCDGCREEATRTNRFGREALGAGALVGAAAPAPSGPFPPDPGWEPNSGPAGTRRLLKRRRAPNKEEMVA